MKNENENAATAASEMVKAMYELGKDYERLYNEQSETGDLCCTVCKELAEYCKSHPAEPLAKAWKAYAKKETEFLDMLYELKNDAAKLPVEIQEKFNRDVGEIEDFLKICFRELLRSANV